MPVKIPTFKSLDFSTKEMFISMQDLERSKYGSGYFVVQTAVPLSFFGQKMATWPKEKLRQTSLWTERGRKKNYAQLPSRPKGRKAEKLKNRHFGLKGSYYLGVVYMLRKGTVTSLGITRQDKKKKKNKNLGKN